MINGRSWWFWGPVLSLVACAGNPKLEKKPLEFVKGNFSRTCELTSEGTMREGFANNSTSGDQPCPTAIQTCANGKWIGPPLFDRCENYTKSCGQTPHGSSEIGFLSAIGTAGNPCVRAQKTCMNGQWIGPEVEPTCFESEDL